MQNMIQKDSIYAEPLAQVQDFCFDADVVEVFPDMIQRFGLVTGLSDHTLDNTTAITSVALGASIIEKHFTLDKAMFGPDHAGSATPAELAQMCAFREEAKVILA